MSWDVMLKVAASLFALSGWFKVYYDHVSNKPKITGRLLTSIRGGVDILGARYTGFFVYPYLVNARKNTVHILDYHLYAKLPHGWVKLETAYGAHKVPNFEFGDGDDKLHINDLAKNLIYVKKEPVQHGVPLHGWLLFLGEESLHYQDILSYKLVCLDVNFKKHEVVTEAKDFPAMLLVSQVADIEFPKSNINPKRK